MFDHVYTTGKLIIDNPTDVSDAQGMDLINPSRPYDAALPFFDTYHQDSSRLVVSFLVDTRS